MRVRSIDEYAGCSIPPEVYDFGFGWDPRPEVERLLFLARECGVSPESALELGCGTGRLLSALRERVPVVRGLELRPEMAELARQRSAAPIEVGDMTDFSIARRFDLIFTSANTIRYVVEDAAIASFWRSVARHLSPGGVFIADLELGLAWEAERVGKPGIWTITRGDQEVRVSWGVGRAPTRAVPRSVIQFTFEARGEQWRGFWSEEFPLRSFDGQDFVGFAERNGLALSGLYELRDPHLVPTDPAKAEGRYLAVFVAR